jgi:hypothetical protein
VTSRAGVPRWVTARDVEAGEVLLRATPLVYVTTLDAAALTEPSVRRLLPEGPAVSVDALVADEQLSFKHGVSVEWLLTYVLLTRHDRDKVDNALAQLAKPAPGARSADMRAALAAMPAASARLAAARHELAAATDDADRATLTALVADLTASVKKLAHACASMYPWLAAIRRRVPDLSDDDVMVTYAIVAANTSALTTPLSRINYGGALYLPTSHVPHACRPTTRAVYSERAELVLEAMSALPAGTTLSLDRYLTRVAPFVRCFQTAPRAVRDNIERTTGTRCACAECIATLTWLRELTGCADATMVPTTIDIETWEAVVESAWREPSDNAELAAVLAALGDTSDVAARVRHSYLGELPIACAMELPAVENELTALFVRGECTLGSVALAQLVLRAAPVVSPVLVDAALDHASNVAPRLLDAKLREQGVAPAQCVHAENEWRAYTACHSASIRARRHTSTEPLDTLALVRAALQRIEAPTAEDAVEERVYEAALRHLHCEQLFAPHLARALNPTRV